MIYLFYTLHVIVCFFLILVVLLQQGKGADLSVFGGGSTQTAFGARSAATLLHKLTVISFVLFILTTISIAVLKGGVGSSTVIGDVAAPAEAVVEEVADEPAGEIESPAASAEEATGDDTAAPATEVGDDTSSAAGDGSDESDQ